MAFYTDNNGNVIQDNSAYQKKSTIVSGTRVLSLAKVFGYMFIGLLITAVIAFAAGFGFTFWMQNDLETASNGLIVIMGISGIALVIMSFVVNFSARKGKVTSSAIPMIIYCLLMGVLLSTFTIFIEWYTLALAFGITALIFGIMTLVASVSKNLSGVGIIGVSMFFGLMILSLVNVIFMLILPQVWTWMYWIITFGTFIAMMLITLWDIWRVDQIAKAGEMTTNIALYCAFTLYVDFIYIFIRILYFIIALKDR